MIRPSREVIDAIVELKRRNHRFGCPRIAQQINLAFGLELDKDVVRRILATHYRPDPGNDQIAVYMWEPNQFKDWKSHDAMLIGMPKGIHLAMDYKLLRHRFSIGSPNPTGERALRVNVEKTA